MKLTALKDKKILILGFGREGKDAFLFLRKLFPNKIIAIADANRNIQDTPNQSFRHGTRRAKYLKGNASHPYGADKIQDVEWHIGKNYLKSLENYEVIIKSPGIPFKLLKRTDLRKVVTQTDIFFENFPGKIIGVTGTKGKSTTSSLIYEVLKAGGVKAKLIGNIGKPVLSYLADAKKDNIFVYELSSHQLYNLKRAPHVAVFLNIFREHLDYYKNFQNYANAKANITLNQTKNDYLIFNANDKIVSKFTKQSKARKIPIKGEYYELDRNAARAVGRIFKITEETIEKSIKKFKPLEHRLEFVGNFKGIDFYNDALATIPEATMAAIDYFKDGVETIMLGGFDRKINFGKLAKKILQSKIKTLILFPTTGEKIWQEIKKNGGGDRKHFFVNDMENAVKLAYQNTSREKICLLSTASSSFSIFKDYKEKGDSFKKYVKAIGSAR